MNFLPARLSMRIAALCLIMGGARLCAAQADITVDCTAPVLIAPQAPIPTATQSAPGATTQPATGTPPPGGNQTAKPAGKLVIDGTPATNLYSASQNTVTFSITNSTGAAIDSLSFSSVGLIDGKTGQKIPGWSPHSPQLIAKDQVAAGSIGSFPKLETNQRTDCTLTLPEINHAGSYAGILRADGSGGYESVISLAVQARGPYTRRAGGWVPVGLMTVVFFVGWLIAVGLDRWFTLKLPVAQQALLLRESLDQLKAFGASLASWEKRHHASLPHAKTNAALVQSELERLLSDIDSRSVADLQQDARQYSLMSDLNSDLLAALGIAAKAFSGPALVQKSAALDAVPQGTDLPTYRAALEQILVTPAAPPAAGVVAPLAAAPHLLGIDLSTASPAAIRGRIEFMDGVKTLVTGAAVWISAYSVLYLGNPCFGTTTDYLNLFLWSLGLSTTGGQIVAQIRRS